MNAINNGPATVAFVDLWYWYDQPDATRTVIIRDSNWQWMQGQSYAIVGPSGSGKSTILHLLVGLLQPRQGKVLYNNMPIPLYAQERETWLQSCVGIMLQQPLLLPEYTVLDNVMIKSLATGAQADTDFAYQLLAALGIEQYAQAYNWQLSGGQQQRVALARALYGNPKFLLADEPTAALDQVAAEQLITLLTTVCHALGVGLIVATHDTRMQQAMNQRLIIEDQQLRGNNI
ncbi:ATP-binding cassette domain-containing protein [Candidatus Dependentiae bacterium]|nr:ATP-binding cassette domain-containing protein [Candidatus Dependentiae bacterium]